MSNEMRKYIDNFKQKLTESENLNISDVSDSRKKIADLLNALDSNMKMLREDNSNDNIEYVLGSLHSIIHELVKTLE